MNRRYESPHHFKSALEARIRRRTAERQTAIGRERMLLIFDRLLARIHESFAGATVLKGGLALEARLARARSTRDIDLRLKGSADSLPARLQVAGRLDLGDYLEFIVDEHPVRPAITGDGVRYEGLRFRVRCALAGACYGDPFGLDVAVGDPIYGEPEVVRGSDLLGFIGIEPPAHAIIPVATHIAEKLHAYTLPRLALNSRVKDLPDLALLALTGPLEATPIRRALAQTFEFRGTHPIPRELSPPPSAWRAPYARIARESRLPWADLDEVTAAARRFLDPVLDGGPLGRWSPDAWAWDR